MNYQRREIDLMKNAVRRFTGLDLERVFFCDEYCIGIGHYEFKTEIIDLIVLRIFFGYPHVDFLKNIGKTENLIYTISYEDRNYLIIQKITQK